MRPGHGLGSVLSDSFSALTLVFERQEGYPICKTPCTINPSMFSSIIPCFSKSRMVYLSGASLPGCPGKKAVKRVCVCVCVLFHNKCSWELRKNWQAQAQLENSPYLEVVLCHFAVTMKYQPHQNHMHSSIKV